MIQAEFSNRGLKSLDVAPATGDPAPVNPTESLPSGSMPSAPARKTCHRSEETLDDAIHNLTDLLPNETNFEK
jgi:hypothetical protein